MVMVDSLANKHPVGPARIELIWPGKGLVPSRDADGAWSLHEPVSVRMKHWFRPEERVVVGDVARHRDSLVVVGDRLRAMNTLRTMVGRRARLAYIDLPRVVVDDKTRAFQGETDRTWSTFLTVVHEH